MGDSQDIANRVCTNCNVAMMHPHQDIKLYKDGWFKCVLCGFCKIIDKEIYTNRIKNQHG